MELLKSQDISRNFVAYCFSRYALEMQKNNASEVLVPTVSDASVDDGAKLLIPKLDVRWKS